MRLFLKSAVVWVGLLSWTAPGYSRAAGPHEEAEAAIERGVQQRKKGDDHQALKEFEQAYAIEKSPRALAQIGLAHMALGHWVEASNALEQALEPKGDAWIAKKRTILENAATQVDHHVGVVEIEGNPPGATVSLNGTPAGAVPLRSKVVAGEVAISVAAGGYMSLLRKVTVDPGTMVRENFTLAALPSAGPPTTPAGPSSVPDVTRAHDQPLPATPHRFGQLPWWTAGTAAAGVGAGITFTLVARSRISDFNGSCGLADDSGQPVHDPSQAGSTDTRCASLYDSWKTDKRWATVSFAAGGVLAATSLVLFLLDSAGDERTPRSATACLPSGAGVSCALTF